MNKLSKLVFIIVVVLIFGGSLYRIITLNNDRDVYTVHYEEVKNGDEINFENIMFRFGEVNDPVIQNSKDFAGKKEIIYQLPITIENKNNREVNLLDGVVKIFINYENFYDGAIVKVEQPQSGKSTEEILSSLPVEEPIKISVTSDLVQGDFFHHYKNYDKEKEAKILFILEPSSEGIRGYYYQLNGQGF